MITHGNAIQLIAGNGNLPLAQEIAKQLKMELCDVEVGTFSDGEISISLPKTVRGRDVFVIQSTSSPVNDNLMELLVMIDALKRASAGRITAVIPYFGYARQDRKAKARDPITAKLVANLLTTAGADRILTMDLHAAQIQGFFDIPLDHLYGSPVLAKQCQKLISAEPDKEWVVVSPDVGSVSRNRTFAAKLNVPLAIVDKRRPKANAIEVMNVIGDVKGKSCIMFDDMIDTAGTICQGAEALIKNGANEVYACSIHGVLSGPAMERLSASPFKKVLLTNTVPLSKEILENPKIKQVSVASIFAKAITRIYMDTSISDIYED
ncbi:MAG: ribose-phosphate pyrophosphokinase [Clostridiales bacterium]|nr:ribose-phosphate pyrophosphokinase [Clostridiales bacterium]